MTDLTTSQPTEVQNEIPKGYLSVGEIAAKFPDWARQIENSAKASLEGASAAGMDGKEARQNTPRVMVYLKKQKKYRINKKHQCWRWMFYSLLATL
jgi:hypothetical protein